MIFIYPFKKPFLPDQVQFGASPNTAMVESVLNGGVQTSETPGKRWQVSLTLPDAKGPARAEVEGFFDALNGQANRVRLWHMGRVGLGGHGTPIGNINTTGVTVKTATAQFATSFTLTGCGAGKALAAGDMFAVGGQLLMNVSNVVANGAGEIVVPATGGLRSAITAGQAITLIRPTALFVLATPDWRSTYYEGNRSSSFAIDFKEVFT